MENTKDANIIQMVDRACMILDYLYKMEESASISALSKELELPKANVYRILYTLQQRGIVEKETETDLYHLGKELIKYGEKVRYDFSLVNCAKHHMKEMAQSLGETVNIGIRDEGNIITLHSEEGEKSVLVSKLIPVAELYCSSMGKLVLSDMTEEERKSYFERPLKKRTVNTIVAYDAFDTEREAILKDGHAFDREEYEYGLSCVAVPIRNREGEIIAMMSVSGPTTRLEFKGLDHIIKTLKNSSAKVQKEMI